MSTAPPRAELPRISRPEKVLFPDSGITKGDLAEHYERVAPLMLPQIAGRPVSMERYPDGIGRGGFYQKDAPEHFPSWIERVDVPKAGGDGRVCHVVCSDAATLVYLADQACITPHVWLSRADRLDRPDRMVLDLDPSAPGFASVRAAARLLRSLLCELGLDPYLMTTGGRGLHVVVPLRRRASFDDVRSFARGVAAVAVRREPRRLTLEQRKGRRGDRVLIDVMRNGYGQTAVPPYAVRARPGAPVAVPIAWEELGDRRLDGSRFTIRNLGRRLARGEDPWAGIDASARAIGVARRRLVELAREG